MSTNLSKQKREDLLNKIKEIRAFISAAPQDENTGNLLSYLSDLEKDVNGKKYGLVFEEHREEIDEVLDTHTPVLTEEKDLFIDNGGQMNFLIEGDNLASLKLLEKTHKGKIDLIFIDPPYNTKNGDFGYDDNRIDLNDSFRHSKWISFMKVRLSLARKLLKDAGVIFVAIDDNEQAALKLLCDQIFGEENFLASIIWQHSIQPKGYSGTFSVHHNYLLCYQKTAQFVLNSLPRTAEDNKAYSNPDNDPRGKWRSGDVRNALYRPNLIYDIISPSGKVIKPCANGWRWSKETVEQKIKTGEIIFSKDETRIIRKIYLDTLSGRTPETIWFGKDVGTTRSAMSEIKEIFGTSAFGTPKPTGLIERTLRLLSQTDTTILDFFAGSGTTGHAVMKLNAEDGGNRRFILCTNNENNICRDVTYERIKRVIDKEGYAASLKYYKVDYVPISDRMYYEYADELLKHIRELVELENGVNFTGNAEIAIVLTEEELDEFMTNIEAYGKCRKLYMGHDLLPDEEQEQSLADHGIEINIIPDYYYQDLQEV
ncbi:MAG: site-specific DNA-methyltransferase [Lachnospiraceae bacterium]|nr:site-specific DNA-methyltransferase [Lachnospiraceae bacterium]